MSVGDVKGFRRRLRELERKGHAPKRTHLTVAESIARSRAMTAKLSEQKPSKKK